MVKIKQHFLRFISLTAILFCFAEGIACQKFSAIAFPQENFTNSIQKTSFKQVFQANSHNFFHENTFEISGFSVFEHDTKTKTQPDAFAFCTLQKLVYGQYIRSYSHYILLEKQHALLFPFHDFL